MARNTDVGKRLQEKVDEFRNILGFKEDLKVSDPFCQYDFPDGGEPCMNSGDPGCYVFTSGEGEVLYIGKASRFIGNRVWSHIGRISKKGEDGAYPVAEAWVKEHSPDIAVWSIPVPKESWWLCLSLEGFLNEYYFPKKPRT